MDQIVKTQCSNCMQNTSQDLLFDKGQFVIPEIVSFDENEKRKDSFYTIEAEIWKITQCKGCEKLNFAVYRRYDPSKDDVIAHSFPAHTDRRLPKWVMNLKIGYLEILGEIYQSITINNFRLALMATRTLLDMYIVEKIGDMGTFKSKLKKLVSENHISVNDRKLLELALEFGHATIHRGFKPTKEEFYSVLDIVENVIYKDLLFENSEQLKSKIPKRK